MGEIEHTTEHIDNRPAVMPITLWPGASPIYVMREEADDVVALLKGERGMQQEAGEPDVRRVLDLGAGHGEFALHCRLRWPQAWVDSVEPVDDLRKYCELNSLAGNRVFAAPPGTSSYDLVRVNRGWVFDPSANLDKRTRILFIDGMQGKLDAPWEQVAGGMRAKGQPFSWWVRK